MKWSNVRIIEETDSHAESHYLKLLQVIAAKDYKQLRCT